MTGTTNPGEDRAWELLASIRAADVCRAAGVTYEELTRRYIVPSLGMNFFVSPGERTIVSESERGTILLMKIGYFFRLSILWYLVSAKDVACTGRLVKLQNVPGGEIFSKGSHMLPTENLANTYGADAEGFLRMAREWGGEPQPLADAAARLYPFPRVPVVITLWTADDEFPARADLMLDSTCSLQLPTDVLWSVAMMSVLIFL